LRSQKQVNTAAERNKEPIFNAIKGYISSYIERFGNVNKSFHCLEISSGTGQHVTYFAPHFPSVTWQPSEVDTSSFNSISAYIADSGVSNISQPIHIDVAESYTKWGGGNVIGKYTINTLI
jgi:Predicted S-adenosylmethionine-dependent methyltransferase